MKSKRAALAVLSILGALLLVGWLVFSSQDEPKRKRSTAEAPAAQAPAEEPPHVEPPRPALQARPAASAVAAARAEIDQHNVVGPGPDDPHEPGMHPHPITPEHERIAAENRLIQTLNDAMAARDVKAMRGLLVQYQKLDPGDVEATQAGYAVIADCIENPGDASMAAARDFYAEQRHSPLRRFVRRICFEGGN